MMVFQITKQLILADFRERTRRYSFLVTLMAIMFFGYLVITDQYTIRFGAYRGEINSAWTGTLMAVASTILLSIVGFYLVKNSIKRDRLTSVGQILAATPLSRFNYIVSKFLSNFLVLALMMAILEAAAVVMYLLYGARGGFDLWAMTAPFLFLSLPAMTFVAAAAVMFEGIRPLSGSIGNIVYLIIIESVLIGSIQNVPYIDLSGINIFIESGHETVLQFYPDAKMGILVGFVKFDEYLSTDVITVPWNGINWTMATLLSRLVWVGMGLIFVMITVPFFDRFDRTRTTKRAVRKEKKKNARAAEPSVISASPAPAYDRIPAPVTRYRFASMLAAEFRLMVKGYHWFWYLIAAGLVAVQLTVPFAEARAFAVSAAMLLPFLSWSAMGTREARYNTAQLLFSSPYPVTRQLPASLAAGTLIALLAMSGMMVRAGITGQWQYLVTLVVAGLFIPSLALTLGALTGSKKLFEVTYFFLWYVGGIEKFTPMNFLGTTDEAVAAGIPIVYFLLTVGLVIIAFLTRRRQVIL